MAIPWSAKAEDQESVMSDEFAAVIAKKLGIERDVVLGVVREQRRVVDSRGSRRLNRSMGRAKPIQCECGFSSDGTWDGQDCWAHKGKCRKPAEGKLTYWVDKVAESVASMCHRCALSTQREFRGVFTWEEDE